MEPSASAVIASALSANLTRLHALRVDIEACLAQFMSREHGPARRRIRDDTDGAPLAMPPDRDGPPRRTSRIWWNAASPSAKMALTSGSTHSHRADGRAVCHG